MDVGFRSSTLSSSASPSSLSSSSSSLRHSTPILWNQTCSFPSLRLWLRCKENIILNLINIVSIGTAVSDLKRDGFCHHIIFDCHLFCTMCRCDLNSVINIAFFHPFSFVKCRKPELLFGLVQNVSAIYYWLPVNRFDDWHSTNVNRIAEQFSYL